VTASARSKAFVTALYVGAGLLCAAVVTSGRADEAASARDFGFRGLEIYEFRHGTTELNVQDVNGDGRDDVVFVNNHAGRIEILLRKADGGRESAALPALSDRFDNVGMLVDQQILFCELGDLDGNGRQDVVAFGSALGLQIWRQTAAGQFAAAERLHLDRLQDVVGLVLADVCGDRALDIAVCRRGGAEILRNDGQGRFARRQTVDLSEETCTGLEILDVTGDGRPDLLFHCQSSEAPLRLRAGRADGEFGLETLLTLPPTRFAALVERKESPVPLLGGILHNGLGLRLYRFAEQTLEPLLQAQERSPQRLPLQGVDRRGAPVWLADDFNGDGRDDVLVAAPQLSQIHFYFGADDGLRGAPLKVDSLAGINSLSRTRDGRVLAVSKSENAAVLHDVARPDVFPQPVRLPGAVHLGMAQAGTNRLLFVCRDENRQWRLVEWQDAKTEPVARDLDLRDEPSAMVAVDMGDGEYGLILFVAHARPVMMRVSPTAIRPVASADFSALAADLTPAQITVLPRADGPDDILAALGGTVRLFRRSAAGYAPLRQFNPGHAQARIDAAVSYRGPQEQPGTLLYDRHARNLLWFTDDSSAASARVHLRHAPSAVNGMAVLRHAERETLLLVTGNSLMTVAGGGRQADLEPGAEYMTAAEKPSLQYFRTVALGRPARPMLAVVDAANRAVEWIGCDPFLRRYLAFEVFQDSGFAGMAGMGGAGGTEPRALAAGDLDGNGAGDMVLLVHDKLLIYLGS
jgi:hypothetical protein